MKFTKNIILFLLTVGWLELHAQNPTFSLPTDLQVTVGETVNVSLSATVDLSPHDIRSYTFVIQYNASRLKASAVTYDDKLQSFSKVSNMQESGKIKLTGASTQKLQGNGILLSIAFEALSAGNSALSFIQAECILNEGTPSASYTNGQINIKPKPTIGITPNTAFLAIGQTIQCQVNGNKTEPVTWGLTNPAIGNISSSGLFTATGHGETRIFVEDAAGLRDTTDGFFKLTAIRLYFPNNLEQWSGMTINIPVLCSDFSTLQVLSGQFVLNFNNAVLQFIEADPVETLLANASVTANEINPGKIKLAFASAQSLSNGSNTLIKLRFNVKPTATIQSPLTFEDPIFNETIEALTENGFFNPKPLPALTLTPAIVDLVAGDSVLFAASNGIQPYTWSVSDERVATVRPNGRLIAKEGGVFDLTVTDAIGATKTLSGINVTDMRIYFSKDTLEKIESVTLTSCFSDSIPEGRPGVFAFEGAISVSNPHVKILDIETAESMTEGWQKNIVHVSDQHIKFYLAGANPFRQHGTVFYLKTALEPDFKEYHTADIVFHNPLVNEGTPLPKFINGSIEGKFFTPQDKTICLGESTGTLTVLDAEGKPISLWKKRLRRPVAGSWINLSVTSATYNDTPESTGEWEYKAVVEGKEVKVANIVVQTVPDVEGTIQGQAKFCNTPQTLRYVVKPRPTALEYHWNYTGSGVVLHPKGNVLDLEITANVTPGTLEMRTANTCGESVEKLTLDLEPSLNFTETKTICQDEIPYHFGTQQLTQNGTYTETFPTTSGCDSVVTLTLTVHHVNVAVNNENNMLTAAADNAVYQWLDCINGNTPIQGAVEKTFRPINNGKFAVRITQNNCTETSECYDFISVGIADTYADRLRIYPNPTSDFVEIEGVDKEVPVNIYDASGRHVLTRSLQNGRLDLSQLANGLYIIETNALRGRIVKR